MSARSTVLMGVEGAMLVAALVVAALTSSAGDWEPASLVFVLLALALASDLFAVRHHGQRISGSFLALVLAMALLGPAPAATLGVASVLFDHLRARNPLPLLVANLAAFATFPLVGGLLVGLMPVAAVATDALLNGNAPSPADVAGTALVAAGVALGAAPARAVRRRRRT
jgi:hypothetical protein